MMDGYEGHYKEYTELQAGNQLLYKLLSGEYSLIHHLTTFPQHYLSGVGSVVRYYPQTLCAMVRVDNDSNYQKNEWICKVGYRRYQGALGEKRMCAARRNGRDAGVLPRSHSDQEGISHQGTREVGKMCRWMLGSLRAIGPVYR